MRVDQGDDQAEGLRQVGSPQPGLDLSRIDLIPAELERAGVAGAEVLRLRILTRIGRVPVGEAVVVAEALGVRGRPARQQRSLSGGMGEMPFPLVGDLVSARAEDVSEALGVRAKLRLLAGSRSASTGSAARRSRTRSWL
jgi:hypothetical protein